VIYKKFPKYIYQIYVIDQPIFERAKVYEVIGPADVINLTPANVASAYLLVTKLGKAFSNSFFFGFKLANLSYDNYSLYSKTTLSPTLLLG
jgi:hypothetical protein